MKVAIQTLGCKVNQYETQAMELLLEQRGHTLVSSEEEADAYIINSCTVTATSDKKSRQYVRQARRRAEGAVVALCGCYPQVSPEEAEDLGVDLIAGTGDREGFLRLLEEVWTGKNKVLHVDDAMKRRAFEVLPGGSFRDRTRAMLKIEDGCTNFCTFCIIPYARGPVRSQSREDTLKEVRRLAAEGYREIVLTGIEISSWGRDLEGEETLTDLVEAICQAAPQVRVRLGSLEPRTVTEDFCARLSKLPNLCHHFHLSLQSGSDGVLRRMNRKYDSGGYLRSVKLLRSYFPQTGITTDLIVGFPGETEAEFQETLDFVRACGFSAMHIFPYSQRKGTPAAIMEGQVPKGEKARRAKRAEEAAKGLEQAFLTSLVGRKLEVLFEEEQDGFWIGHSSEYVQVKAKGDHLKNRLFWVTVRAAGEQEVYGDEMEEVPSL